MNIEVNNLRGQGYDGAAVMSGKMNGVAVLVKKNILQHFIYTVVLTT
ncbi:unnamed protein product [Aphis gossypii]|uniref:Uncharacterized protein n=1 Tax=Aphis gossypii TaxID=80765 RepID=A0A9P0NEW0_APHGO|nr:unnamed protein product [Aphis gossypii]